MNSAPVPASEKSAVLQKKGSVFGFTLFGCYTCAIKSIATRPVYTGAH